MVNSILNTKVNYPEIKKLDAEDRDYDASMYEVSVLGVSIIIALGQAKYTFIDEDIIYYPIYLVKDDKVSTQIGVYEIMANQLPNIIDEDGDVELEKIDVPLLYKFVTPMILKNTNGKMKSSPDTSNQTEVTNIDKKTSSEDDEDTDDEDSEEDKDSEEDEDSEEDDREKTPEKEYDELNIPLPEQNEKQVELELSEYKEEKTNPWIQKYLKSQEYKIIDNEGGGDCLFAVIRDALKGDGKDTSVMELRNKLSTEVTEEVFKNYKEHYDMYVMAIHDADITMKELSKTINELRDRLRNSKDRSEQEKIVENAKIAAEKYKNLKLESKVTKDLLHEFRFMKNIHTIDDFKRVIKTCDFWGDTWAISTLERVLNIKLILFSSESWEQGDTSNVLQCGQLNDKILEEKGSFEPRYYIMLDYTGTHYKLITYKNHRIFNFTEIPYNVKLLITNKCLERLSGPYSLIPQFKLFNAELGIDEPIDLEVEVIKESVNELYTNDIAFQYYIKSNNKPLPGKGVGEKIPADKIKEFSKLSQIPEWRRKLDNEYESPFELDGHKWSTVEHYYQASKFKNTNKEYYLLFSLDSDSKISKDVDMAKSAGSKTGKYKKELLRPKEIKIDDAFYQGLNDKILEDALYAKFSQNIDMKDVLMNTKKAKLLLYRQGMEPEVSNTLMIVRNRI